MQSVAGSDGEAGFSAKQDRDERPGTEVTSAAAEWLV